MVVVYVKSDTTDDQLRHSISKRNIHVVYVRSGVVTHHVITHGTDPEDLVQHWLQCSELHQEKAAHSKPHDVIQ